MDNLLVSGVSYFVQNALLTPLQRFLFSVLSYNRSAGLGVCVSAVCGQHG